MSELTVIGPGTMGSAIARTLIDNQCDHTRENIPVIMFGPDVSAVNLGRRDTFADIGQTVTSHPGFTALDYGTNCFSGHWV